MAIDRQQLIQRVQEVEGLSDDERAGLLQLLREQKKYGIVWEDKPEAAEQQLAAELPVLTKVKERYIAGATPDAPNHILIEGDNLHALTALSYTHEGKIDVIYIDPPYNTGNKDFVYNDSFVDREDGYRHSKWLSFMNKRLQLAKRLLSERGVIFISIDDNEQAQLKLLCDEVFGEQNCRNIINTRRLDKNLSQQFVAKGIQSLAVGCEYVLLYSKTSEVELSPIQREAGEERKTNGYWKGFWNAADRPTMRYDILGFTPETGQWKWKEDKAKEAVNNYNTFLKLQNENPLLTIEEYWIKTGKRLKFIRRLSGKTGKNSGVEHWVEPTEGILRTSNWSDIITTEIHLGFDIDFSSPKSRDLLKTIIKFGNVRKDITILDFFAGSGTTLHATMQLNAEDGGHRQCILVTNNENGICENVTYERNRRVIQGYTTPKGVAVDGLADNSLRYYRTDFVPNDTTISNKRRLMSLCTDMLCIKNNLYCEQDEFAGRKLNKQKMRFFTAQSIINCQSSIVNYTSMLVVYDEQVVDTLVDVLTKMDVKQKIMIYVFSNTSYPHTDNFEEVLTKVELCALPSAILNAYRKITRR